MITSDLPQMMDDSDRFKNSNLTKLKENTPLNQVMTCKASTMERVLQLVQRVAQKSCRRACQLFCCHLDTLLFEKVTGCPVAHQNPASTILILNISNSTLIDCAIGNGTYPSAMAESRPLMQESGLQMHDQARCSCSRGPQEASQTSPRPPPCTPLPSAVPPSINIQSSHLNCVIIGDNNYMHAEQSNSPETEPQV